MPATIYLHWAATPYSWVRQGCYHTIVAGDGRIQRLHAYSVDLPAHTYRRNTNNVALCCACMVGVPNPWTIPAHRSPARGPLPRSRRSGPQLGLERQRDHDRAADDPR